MSAEGTKDLSPLQGFLVWWYQSPGVVPFGHVREKNTPVCVLVAPSGLLSRSDHIAIRLICADKILGSGWIFRTKCDFLQVLDLLIFRQKQPGHWAEVVCHFCLK